MISTPSNQPTKLTNTPAHPSTHRMHDKHTYQPTHRTYNTPAHPSTHPPTTFMTSTSNNKQPTYPPDPTLSLTPAPTSSLTYTTSAPGTSAANQPRLRTETPSRPLHSALEGRCTPSETPKSCLPRDPSAPADALADSLVGDPQAYVLADALRTHVRRTYCYALEGRATSGQRSRRRFAWEGSEGGVRWRQVAEGRYSPAPKIVGFRFRLSFAPCCCCWRSRLASALREIHDVPGS